MTRFGRVEALSDRHDVSAFDCGSSAQTTWLRRHALQAQRSDTARVYVVCQKGSTRVVGYYALASGSVTLADAPSRATKGAGRHPVPVVILTRLGVDTEEQGKGLGAALVRDALLQVLSIAEQVGVRALLIHAESDTAARFYRHLEPSFESSPTDARHLLLLMKDLRASFKEAIRQRYRGSWSDELLELKRPAVDAESILRGVRATAAETEQSG